jgi:uncharacterized protein (DUF302 family)
MKRFALLVFSLLCTMQVSADNANVLAWELGTDLETSYKTVYKALEDNRFFVVFEPNIQRNLSAFAKRWGDDYNRNKLEGIRAMVFCNAWYANQVSNADPDMLALCPLHITLVQKQGKTRVLFVRPSVVAKDSQAAAIASELEQDVTKAIEQAQAVIRQ